jgi:hypothetical protein
MKTQTSYTQTLPTDKALEIIDCLIFYGYEFSVEDGKLYAKSKED